MRDQFLKQAGLCLVAIAYVLARCAAGAAQPTPAAAPRPRVEILPGPPLKTESEPSQLPAPAPGAAPQSEAGWQLPPLVPRPDFISRRPLIPDFLFKDKREGHFITAVPAIGWDQKAELNLGKALGSDFEYERVTSSIYGYRTVFPEIARLVLAGRGLYSLQFGNVPFFSAPMLAFNTRDRSGLGGFATMRGFIDRRFVGDSAVLVNTELRWSIFDGGYLWGQHLRPMLAPFVDAGRVFDGTQLRLDGWRADCGIGFRLIWNLVTTVSFDYGISSEGQIFQMDLGYAF